MESRVGTVRGNSFRSDEARTILEAAKEDCMSTRLAGRVLSAVFLVAVISFGGVLRSQDVRTNAMPGTDFSKYHSYKWVAIQGASHPNQIVDAEIKQSVDAQLSTKGLTKTD